MSKRTRIFLGILLIYAIGIAAVLYLVVTDIDPRYRESAEESLLLIKTRLANFSELERFIKQQHPYEVPEIVWLPIAAGSEAYLRWMGEETK